MRTLAWQAASRWRARGARWGASVPQLSGPAQGGPGKEDGEKGHQRERELEAVQFPPNQQAARLAPPIPAQLGGGRPKPLPGPVLQRA